ncbi:MAG TPA: PEP/pyruvate-binding domain-containing protein, partial [Chroococcales cyanobacterium]
MTYLISSDNGQDVGGKAKALFALRNFPVPPFFVLAPRAYADGLNKEQLCLELQEALKELCPNGERVAVRSSALDEDGISFSFAGQFESYLFVSPEEVPEKVLLVWASAFSERVLAYRRENDLLQAVKPPAVLIQRMVDADAAGVAFGADPVSGR